jgi:hypothetical protein
MLDAIVQLVWPDRRALPRIGATRNALILIGSAAVLLTGCSNSTSVFGTSLLGSQPAPALAHSGDRPMLDCSPRASVMGAATDTSSLSLLLSGPAANPAVQGCGWEQGTRVTYGPQPATGWGLTTGSTAERK